MAKDETIFILIILLDVVYSILLTGSNWTKFPGETIAVICKDEGGRLVMWRGPKGPLGAHSRPSVLETGAGKMLVFDHTRITDTGNYTCSLISDERDKKVFSLIVEEPNSFDILEPQVETQITHPSNSPKELQPFSDYQNRLHTEPPKTTTEDPVPQPTQNQIFYKRPHYTPTTYSEIHQTRYYNKMKTTKEPIDFRDTPTIQRGVEGQDVALRCEVSGPSLITWIVPDGNLTNPRYKIIGDGLVVRNVSREDTDQVYLCEASQRSTGELKRRNITLIVEHPPIPEEDAETGEVYAQDDEIYGFIGETVNLTCAVRAEPAPKFEWFKRHKGGKNYRINYHQPFLEWPMTENTEGEYLCVASNTHGKLEKTINLRVGRRPEAPGNVTLENSTADSLILNVELPEVSEDDVDEGMQPTWLVIQYRKENSDEWGSLDLQLNMTEDESYPTDDTNTSNSSTRVETFTLSNLKPKTRYEVKAATKNIASFSDYTEPAFFETSSSGNVREEICHGAFVLYFMILIVPTLA